MAKVLLLNGSPRPNGCTATALKEMIPVFEAEGIETEIIHVGNKDIRGCISCGSCANTVIGVILIIPAAIIPTPPPIHFTKLIFIF